MNATIRTLCIVILSFLIMGSAGMMPFPTKNTEPTASQSSTPTIQGNPNEQYLQPSSAQGPNDPAELEAFLDALFTNQMEESHIAGMTFTLVKDGKTFFQKGYGYADLEQQKLVDPNTTLFRIGSMTKLFTWTAVMQLVEQGKLNLDADVNTYLDFKIPDTFPEAVTLKHLMTHTAGFEERAFDTKVASYDQLQPLGKFLPNHLPARVRPVGQIAAYSNYGADLAGYIVERVSGIPYADYIETNILKPLQMDRTTPRLPLPLELTSQMSSGYRSIQNTIQPGAFQIPGTSPDCCISSTAADMARFIAAHLNDGQAADGDGKILDSATEQLMQSRQWAPDERLTGFTYGFFECILNGQRILYHGGDISPFHGLVALIPSQNLGFFVAYNTDTAAGLGDVTLLAFLEHYFPRDGAVLQPPKNFEKRAKRFAGYYLPARSSYTTLEKINSLGNMLEVKPSRDGAILIGSPFSPATVRLVETGPLLFSDPNGMQVAFREDGRGSITHLFDIYWTGLTYEKLPWHANPTIHYGLLAVCVGLFLSAILAAPAGFILLLFKKGKRPVQPPLSRVARWLAFAVAALDFLGFVSFLLLITGDGFGLSIQYGQMATINIILAVWLGAAILTLVFLVFTALAWKNHYWGIASRVHYTLVMIAAFGFIWFLNYWNLLGFRY